MALENPVAFSVQSSPTLSGVPYQTPSRGTSRQSSCHRSSSQYMSSSPPPLPYDEDSYLRAQNDRDDVGNDENISALDPRRFTPNLHASLVSEILSLRREIEGKSAALGSLEETLHDTKTENDQLTGTLKNQVAEVRSVKKQMHLLETGTLSALGEMAKERDEATDNLNETLKRLDSSKTKQRAQENEVERTHRLWDQDRQTWDVEKRNMERKVHVVEGRLRTILAEVAAVQASGSHPSSTSNDVDDGMRETWFTKSSDTNSNRSNSVKGRSRHSGMSQDGSDVPNFRSSTLSGLNGFGGTRLNGLSLAEELEFDEEEQDHLEESDQDGVASPGALPEEAQMRPRRLSVQQQTQDSKARKVLGLLVESNERLIQEAFANEKPVERIDEKSDDAVNGLDFQYRDTATQFSPPSSPKSRLHDTSHIVERNPEQTEHVANQRRKRVSIMSVSSEQTSSTKPGQSTVLPMISAGCQTLEPLIPPPPPPINPRKYSGPAPVTVSDSPQVKSATTQTDEDDVLMAIYGGSRDDPFMTVPIIAIHPPASRPPSSHNSVVLPPRTKNAACQASIERPVSLKSVSVQTEDFRLGKRHVKIPSRSLLSHVPSKSSSKAIEEKDLRKNQTSPRKTSRKNLQRPPHVDPSLPRMKTPVTEFVDSYPGNNDNGPLNNNNNKQSTDLRRPVRVDSLFAGFESAQDPPPQLAEIDFSDDEFANMAPVRKTLSKVQNSWKLIPQSESRGLDTLQPDNEPSSKEAIPHPVLSRQVLANSKMQMPTREAPVPASAKPLKLSGISKEPDIRRTALISSGAAAHTTRARSPSAPVSHSKESITIPPPFPVPTRSSSRKIPISASDGAQSPTPYSTKYPGSRVQDFGRPPSKNAILRKVRSATAVPKFGRHHRRRSRSRSPPPSTSTIALESPQLPRLPQHEAMPPRARTPRHGKEQFSASSFSPVIEAPADSVNNPTSVVDAIAQTMVGEWMWKYVRRRKSFGISESAQVDFDVGRSNGESGNGSGIRHKRWVWLAPYERAILWSSKQPTSGPALLGKSGRKLTIQSVLDVKDDTPMPRNSDPQLTFGRSILILTPQRALKFTAFNQERHQIWLTALSFLSHSSLGMSDLANIPPIPLQEYQRPPSQGSLGGFRRGTIRDSIRIAKSKGRPPLEGGRAHTNPLNVPHPSTSSVTRSSNGDDNLSLDAAEPPFVPRVSAHTHTRKRSNTGPRPIPPNASQNFAIHASMPSNYSLKATLSQDGYSALPRGNGQTSAGHSIYETNGGSLNTVRNNFFDAVGTVRMEAFIDQGENRFGQSSQVTHRKKETRSSQSRQVRKKDLSYWGVGGPIGQEFSLAHGNDSRWRGEDPFKGF